MTGRTTALRDKVIAELDKLPNGKVKEVVDFVSYLRAKEEWEATKEILSDKELVESIKRGEKDIKAGRHKSWKEVKENV